MTCSGKLYAYRFTLNVYLTFTVSLSCKCGCALVLNESNVSLQSPVFIKAPSTHIIYTAGDRVVLPCSAQGRPTPRYYYYLFIFCLVLFYSFSVARQAYLHAFKQVSSMRTGHWSLVVGQQPVYSTCTRLPAVAFSQPRRSCEAQSSLTIERTCVSAC